MERIVTETPNLSKSTLNSRTSSLWSSFNDSTESASSYGNVDSAVSSSENGSKSNIIRYLLIIVVLGFLGINLFSYLGNVVEYLKNTFGPSINSIISFFGIAASETTKTAVDVTAKASKLGIDVAAGTITSGINVLENTLDGNAVRNNIDSGKISLDKALQNAERNINKEIIPEGPIERKPTSKIQGNLGFCYIGEYKGFRSCASITESDKCLSGDIFPTREICINPNLRQ